MCRKSENSSSSYQSEIKFIFYVLGLYIAFINWGILQEKLTKTTYLTTDNKVIQWDYPVLLNLIMAFSAHIFAAYVNSYNVNTINTTTSDNSKPFAPIKEFWRAALTCAVASPLGYASLKYISFPMMILVKSSKPVPIMVIGTLLYKQRYALWKYISVLLLTSGIAMFSYFKASSSSSSSSSNSGVDINDINISRNRQIGSFEFCPSSYTDDECSYVKGMLENFIGILLVGMNLAFDGFTNNEQDALFIKYNVSGYDMMRNVNLWQSLYLASYLVLGWYLTGEESELYRGWYALSNSPRIASDVGIFSLCACVGQCLIFNVIKEFGSLTWVTISITRKLFTILFSVFIYKHAINIAQWSGVGLVFVALILEIVMKYNNNNNNNNNSKTVKAKQQ